MTHGDKRQALAFFWLGPWGCFPLCASFAEQTTGEKHPLQVQDCRNRKRGLCPFWLVSSIPVLMARIQEQPSRLTMRPKPRWSHCQWPVTRSWLTNQSYFLVLNHIFLKNSMLPINAESEQNTWDFFYKYCQSGRSFPKLQNFPEGFCLFYLLFVLFVYLFYSDDTKKILIAVSYWLKFPFAYLLLILFNLGGLC